MASKRLTDPQIRNAVKQAVEANEPDKQTKEDVLKGVLEKLGKQPSSKADLAAEKFGDLLEQPTVTKVEPQMGE